LRVEKGYISIAHEADGMASPDDLGLGWAVRFAKHDFIGRRSLQRMNATPQPRRQLVGLLTDEPKQVLAVSLSFFALAALAGLALVIVTQQWWLLAVGAVAIVAAWFYTGGKHPYGYYGLGELFVFVFFGLVATAGSAYVQALTVNLEAWLGGVGAGLLACAVLMANNLRDVAQDKAARKRTLAVLVGPSAGRILFAVFMLVPFAFVVFFALLYPTAWLVMFALLLAIPACIIVLWSKTTRELLLALQLASFTALAYGVGLGLAFAF